MNITSFTSRFFSGTALSALVLGAGLAASSGASAQNVSLNIGGMVAPGVYGSVSIGQPVPVHYRHHHHQPVYVPPRVVYSSPPAYYAPPPVYYPQPQTYYSQPPVYYQQPPVIVRPPVVVAPRYYGNPGYGYGYGHGHRGHHRGHY